MYFKFDQWLISQLEAGCNLFARLTGKSNFFLARLFIVLATAAGVLMMLHSNLGSSLYILVSIILIIFVIWMMSTYVDERKAKTRLERGLANPRKISGYPARAIDTAIFALVIPPLLSSSMTIFAISNFLFILFYIIADYLLACDVKPPAKSLVRQLLDFLAPRPALVPLSIKK